MFVLCFVESWHRRLGNRKKIMQPVPLLKFIARMILISKCVTDRVHWIHGHNEINAKMIVDDIINGAYYINIFILENFASFRYCKE